MTEPTAPADAGWIDISIPLRDGIPIFAGDPAFHLERAFSIAGGAAYNVSRLDMGVHTGTHLDAPLHSSRAARRASEIPLAAGMGPAWVVDATGLDGTTIGAEELVSLTIPAEATRLLFKTRNSALWAEPGFQRSFIGLDGAAAATLAARRRPARRRRLPQRRSVRRRRRDAPGAPRRRRRDPRGDRPAGGGARARSSCFACRFG